MANLSDLAKESSFRRFYLRWLAACWLPALIVALPFAVLAMDMWLKLYRASFTLIPVSNLALPVFWLLVALGQSWFLRQYSPLSRRWAATVMLAGVAASFALFLVAGLTFIPSTGILFVLLVMASTATGLLDPNPWLMAAGGAAFGLVLSAVLSLLITSSIRLRALWIAVMTVAGAAIFALLWPLCDTMIWTWVMLRFPPRTTLPIVFSGVMGAPTGVLLAGWVFWSSVAGVVLWYMRVLQARYHLARTKQIFD